MILRSGKWRQNFSNFTWHLISHYQLLLAMYFRPDPARNLSANLHDMYHCCVYSEKLLMMDRGTVRNMWSFIPKEIADISASVWFYYKKAC